MYVWRRHPEVQQLTLGSLYALCTFNSGTVALRASSIRSFISLGAVSVLAQRLTTAAPPDEFSKRSWFSRSEAVVVPVVRVNTIHRTFDNYCLSLSTVTFSLIPASCIISSDQGLNVPVAPMSIHGNVFQHYDIKTGALTA